MKKLTKQEDFHKEIHVDLKNKVVITEHVPTVCKINVKGLMKPLRLKLAY